MDLWATIGILVRRWYVVVPTLLLSLGGVIYVFASVPTQYESKAVILLSAPLTGGTLYNNGFRPDTTNPLLNSSNGLDLTGSLLIEAMQTAEFGRAADIPTDGSADVAVNNGTANPELLTHGPFVFVQVDARSPAAAQDLVRRIVGVGRTELAARQSALGAPPSTFVNYNVIVPATEPTRMRGNRVRAAGAVGGLGMILCLTVAFGADSLLVARRRRRVRAEGERATLLIHDESLPEVRPVAGLETASAGPAKS